MRTHHLKTWPAFFENVENGRKAFEVRRNDRDYQVGDILVLQAWEPARAPEHCKHDDGRYCGGSVRAEVTYVMHGGQFGLEPGYVVMGIKVVTQERSNS